VICNAGMRAFGRLQYKGSADLASVWYGHVGRSRGGCIPCIAAKGRQANCKRVPLKPCQLSQISLLIFLYSIKRCDYCPTTRIGSLSFFVNGDLGNRDFRHALWIGPWTNPIRLTCALALPDDRETLSSVLTHSNIDLNLV
jgi:hypothetical protein